MTFIKRLVIVMIVCIIINIINVVIFGFYFSFKRFYAVETLEFNIKEYITYVIVFIVVNSIMFFIRHLFNDEDGIKETIKNKNTLRWWLI